jgi:hypothetical protein
MVTACQQMKCYTQQIYNLTLKEYGYNTKSGNENRIELLKKAIRY